MNQIFDFDWKEILRMWWRQNVVLWLILSVSITTGVISILVGLMLLPSILDGPDALHYLQRGECSINSTMIITQKCLRDTSMDFSDMVYRPSWVDCSRITMNITSTVTPNHIFEYDYPTEFMEVNEAEVELLKPFFLEKSYECVCDTTINICYPDKKEIFVFFITLSSLLFISMLFVMIYKLVKIKFENDKIRTASLSDKESVFSVG